MCLCCVLAFTLGLKREKLTDLLVCLVCAGVVTIG
jgi:hypothetical protein